MTEPTRVDLSRVAQDLQIKRVQVENVVALLDEGNTVPFITRYRKERTGNLDEETIRRIQRRVANLRVLIDRKATVTRSIESQGKLTEELRAMIDAADSIKRLEDLYLPYKPKKRTLATQARSKGLEPLAEKVWSDDESVANLEAAAAAFLSAENELATVEDVLAGVGHIIAENIAESASTREAVRKVVWETGKLTSSRIEVAPEERANPYRDYFDYAESLAKIPPHRILALNRGSKQNILKTKVELDTTKALGALVAKLPGPEHRHRQRLESWASDSLSRLLLPVLERESRRELTDRAEEHATVVFAKNLRSLLIQSPVRSKRVLAIDPGFRTGCKLAVIDEIGNLIAHGVIFPHPPNPKPEEAKAKLIEMISENKVDVLAIGNGTACRETEEFIAGIIDAGFENLSYTIVNEAGASVYSASSIGREEFPDYDATLRGTISIGRRLQDPLSELVKIDPQSIGVGLYQHDVQNKRLRESLEDVVESCVNYVGVDLNTASVPLLRFVSGLNQLTARRIVEHRSQNGPYSNRSQLRAVPGIGEAVFTQAAGFLKIPSGDNPLDSTWIHPESYPVTNRLLEQYGFNASALREKPNLEQLRGNLQELDVSEISSNLEVGTETMRDIVEALQKPGRDPREDLPPPIFKKGILKIEDLAPGMEVRGTVLNVVDFGAFVDIGLKDSGLIHISELSTKFVRSPHDLLSVGQIVKVWVLSVDVERRRVALTLVAPGTPRPQPQKKTQKRALHKPHPTKPPAKKPKKKAAPLPESVIDGKEPMRSLGDLKQFWDKTRKKD